MKKQYLLRAVAFFVGLIACLPNMAQTTNSWKGVTLAEAVEYCNNGGYVYLYNVESGKFITAGGAYGVQATLGEVGMRMKLSNTYTYYKTSGSGWYTSYTQTTGTNKNIATVETRVSNAAQGSFMATDQSPSNGSTVYLDRKGNETSPSDDSNLSYPNWYFSAQTTSSPYNYQIRATKQGSAMSRYLGSADGSAITTRTSYGTSNYTTWRIITEEEYIEEMNNLEWGEINVNAFIKDADFTRDNKDAEYWAWQYADKNADTEYSDGLDHWHLRTQNYLDNANDIANINGSDNFRNEYGKYYCAEIYNEVNELSQEVEISKTKGLAPGLYKLTCQGFYFDDKNTATNNDVAFFFVKKVTKDGDNNETTTEEKITLQALSKDDYTKKIQTTTTNIANKGWGYTANTNNSYVHSGVAAGKFLADNSSSYVNTLFLEVNEGETITLGFRQTAATGWSVMDNFHLYACGNMNTIVSEDFRPVAAKRGSTDYLQGLTTTYYAEENGAELSLDDETDPYDKWYFNNKWTPVKIYYLRTMSAGKWSSICLPFDMTAQQITNAFGAGTKLSTMDGLNKDKISELKFTAHSGGITAGQPYIIKPAKDPYKTAVSVGVLNQNEAFYIEDGTPYYIIIGLQKEKTKVLTADDDDPDDAVAIRPTTTSGSTDNKEEVGTVSMVGSFYKWTKDSSETDDDGNEIVEDDAIQKGDYYVTRNTMYHATGNRTLYATYCKITYSAPTGNTDSKILSFVFDEDGVQEEITGIDGLVTEGFEQEGQKAFDGNVYNMNGQKVGSNANTEGLPKGIYIVNGKKTVVK